ncbi:MAG: sugar phosphate isomerase/epimerase [Planctomycetota bacterium]|nr:sugar phosphate isomerase/epimerase [Planctomycetota bacterium]
MARPVTLFTGQWADLDFETMCQKAASFGYDGIELACWGDHVDVEKAAGDRKYAKSRKEIAAKHGLQVFAISNHLAGQAVCDNIDGRHRAILNDRIWGDGEPEGVRKRAADEMKMTAHAAKNIGVGVVNGFTGSSIWHLLYSFPPVAPETLEAGYADFARRWRPILNEFDKLGINFALEVHPTEIAFDIASTEMALKALRNHRRFGFNYDPSHLLYQNVDYVKFIRKFAGRIFHVHMKDVYMSDRPCEAGVFGGHTNFGDPRRTWDFRSLGRGSVDFEEIIRALNDVGYRGPLSVEWEDGKMDREHGAAEAAHYVKALDFEPSAIAFDAQFDKKKQAPAKKKAAKKK